MEFGQSQTYLEAYQTPELGVQNDPCSDYTDCQDGLQCAKPSYTCQLKDTAKHDCYRSPFDQRCHTLTSQGNRVLCKDKHCSPLPASQPPEIDTSKHANPTLYYHQPSGSAVCLMTNQENGQKLQVSEKHCFPLMDHAWDLEPDYVKHSLGPQYYGLKW